MRQLDAKSYRGIKTAARALVDTFGTQEAAAAATRVSHVSLSNYCSHSTECAQTFIPIDVCVDLCAASRDLSFLEHIAAVFNKQLVDIPTGEVGDVVEKFGTFIKESSEANICAVDGVLNHGPIKDRAKVIRELRECQVAIADLLTTLEVPK